MAGSTTEDPWRRLRELPPGREVEIRQADGRRWRGTLVPSHGLSGERIVQLKLENGYNVGLRIEPADAVTVFDEAPAPGAPAAGTPPPARSPPSPDAAGWIALLTTGGTIASRIDYRTGGVRPVRDETEILRFYPDLERDGPVRVVPVLDRLSEDIDPDDWLPLARRVARAFADGARGVVVAHGTDTLAVSAAALAFLLENLPGPVVFVGAQRSPDRPSSDGFSNLTHATRVARDERLHEVVVLMHAGLSDDRFAIHRATQVRKMHASRRDAFESRNAPPLGHIAGARATFERPLRPAPTGPLGVAEAIDRRAGLLYFHPGLDPERAERFVAGLRGVVLAGTGLGHVAAAHLPWIRASVARGTVVAMTTQCLAGAVDPYVYATGRELLGAGVLYLHDLLPETAFVKMLWALGAEPTPEGVARRLLEDRAGEFEPRHRVGRGP